MRAWFRTTAVAIVFGVVPLLGCISLGGLGKGESIPPLTLHVNNNLSTPTNLSIYAVSSTGRVLLGNIDASGSKDFDFSPASYVTTYRLVAQSTLGGTMRSQTFSVGSASTERITWSLVPNTLVFDDSSDDDKGGTNASGTSR